MATEYLLPLSIIPQWFTNLGVMAGQGTVQTYNAGTTTPLTTYSDSTGLVANPNPMTLSSTGRAASSSGSPVAFWVPSGSVVDAYVYDSAGNLLQVLKGLTAIGDPAAGGLQTLLASPASSNASGVGPVGGVDFVANAIKSYDTIADVRAANEPQLATGQTLNIQVQGGSSVNDGLGGDFYWNSASTATDNGTTVIKPSSITTAGRWLRLYTPPYGAMGTIATGTTTDLGTLGTNFIQVQGSGTITSFGSSASTARPLFFVTFNAANTLTYNASSLIIPGGASITTAAGDVALAQYLGSGNWQILSYNRAAGSAASSQIAFLTAIQSTSSNTTLTAVTGLVLTGITAGQYLLQLRLLIYAVSVTTAGYKVGLTFSGTTTPTIPNGSGVITANSTSQTATLPLGGSLAAASNSVTPTQDAVNIDMILNVATTGTLQVTFAQNTSTVTATDIAIGSAMILTPL